MINTYKTLVAEYHRWTSRVIPRRVMECSIKMSEVDWRTCECDDGPFPQKEIISWPAQWLPTCQKWLCTMELLTFSYLTGYNF